MLFATTFFLPTKATSSVLLDKGTFALRRTDALTRNISVTGSTTAGIQTLVLMNISAVSIAILLLWRFVAPRE